MDNIKKVACLYRVSSKKQADENDIPLQKKACQEFIKERFNWVLIKEYYEIGISGYHKSSGDRDALMEMKNAAEKKEFDILLVFMFDRLGRREDETSFIVEWLVEKGIEVWSVNEGQQRFDDHVDKLLNYIRFWHAGTESENSSIRVAEKHSQMVKQGKFRGGPPPYGYKLVYCGEFNKKGYELKKLVVNEGEAEIVRLIFTLMSKGDTGSYKVALTLNSMGIGRRNGKQWNSSFITALVKNPIYKGDYVSGKVINKRDKKVANPRESWIHSDSVINELVIIKPQIWQKVNENLALRNTHRKKEYEHKKDMLLLNLLYCGYCGAKLEPHTSGHKRKIKSTQEIKSYYSYGYTCPTKTKGEACRGQFSYGMNKVEGIILNEVAAYLNTIENKDIMPKLRSEISAYTKKIRNRQNIIKKEINSRETAIATLYNEICGFLMGTGSLPSTSLADEAQVQNRELETLHKEKLCLENEYSINIEKLKSLLCSNKETCQIDHEFGQLSKEEKKTILSKMISKINVYRNTIEIEFMYNLHKGFLGQ